MRRSVFESLGREVRALRQARGLTQPQLAARVGRDPARISELERDLRQERAGKDRLTLLAQVCEALDVTPVLVPNARIEAVARLIEPTNAVGPRRAAPASAFDDVFVDLSDDDNAGA